MEGSYRWLICCERINLTVVRVRMHWLGSWMHRRIGIDVLTEDAACSGDCSIWIGSVLILNVKGDRLSNKSFSTGEVMEQLILMKFGSTITFRSNKINATSCWILLGVSLTLINFVERVVLITSVHAVGAELAQLVDAEEVFGIWREAVEIALHLGSLARVLRDLDHSHLSECS